MARTIGHRQARDAHRLASQGIPAVREVEESPSGRTTLRVAGSRRSDSSDEPSESRLERTTDSRRTTACERGKKGLPSLIYHEPALEVRFVLRAAGTTSYLTIRVPTQDFASATICSRMVMSVKACHPSTRNNVQIVSVRDICRVAEQAGSRLLHRVVI
jgi:hypothetical protein